MVRIEDNGIGIKPERIKGLLSYEQDHSKHGMTHIGLRHVHKTVQLYYGRDMGYGWKARKTEERGSQSRLRDKGGRLCTECRSWMTKRSRVRAALDLRLGEIRLPACGRGLEWTAGHEVDRKRGFGHSDHGYRDAGHGRVGTDLSDKGALSWVKVLRQLS